MECDLCNKPLAAHTPCHCPVCARTALYPLRLEHASVLLEKEALGKHVEAILKSSESSSTLKGSQVSQESVTVTLGGTNGGILVDRNECAKRVDFDRARSEAEDTAFRVYEITQRAEALKKEMEEMRKQMAAKRSTISQKRNDLASANHGIAERRANETEKVKKAVTRAEYKSDKVHIETVKARASLCREAAALHGLRRTKRKAKDGSIKEVYYIGFNRIYDLRDLNNAVPEMLTASLETLARLLVHVSSYLAVRLPAEITLPHREWPGLTIYTPASSYHDLEIPHPAQTSSSSSGNSPSASRTLPAKNLPRPRPLYIDRPLPQLYKEDQKAYNLFVEGIACFAYDIAWLCRVQGVSTPDLTKLEEVSAIGRNMYHLLFRQTAAVTQDDSARTGTSTPSSTSAPTAPPMTFGEYSHGTAHYFLSVTHDHRGLQIMTPRSLPAKLKSTLVSEMQSAEWEVLDEQEWNQMDDDIKDDPVVVGTKKRGNSAMPDDGRGALSTIVEQLEKTDVSQREKQEREKSRNGWTKLKSRTASDQGPQP